MVKVVNAIIMQDKKLVIVRKEVDGNSSWIFPGGKSEEDEEDLDCISRELKEELPKLSLEGRFDLYGYFTGISPNNGSKVEATTYKFSGKSNYDLSVSTSPSERIKEARMEDYEGLSKLALSETARKIILSLRSYGEL